MKIRYDEIRVGDVIRFHGADEVVISVFDEGDSEHYPGERVIGFELAPANAEAEQILGKFYSHGEYGGVGFCRAELISRPCVQTQFGN